MMSSNNNDTPKSISSMNSDLHHQRNIHLSNLSQRLSQDYGEENANEDAITPLVNAKRQKYKEHWNRMKFNEAFEDDKKPKRRESDLVTDPSLREGSARKVDKDSSIYTEISSSSLSNNNIQ